MKRSVVTSIVGAAVLGAAMVAVSPLAAQRGAAPPAVAAGPAPKMPDGHPDLSGAWWPGNDVPLRPLADAPAPVPAPGATGGAPQRGRGGARATFASLYNGAAAEKAKKLGDKDDPALRCVPVAFGTLNISLLGQGFVGQIVQSPKFVVMLTETYHGFKIVPTDGRKHRDDVAPSWRGDSVGRWEGDTLVVDTTNFTDSNWMHAEGIVSFHSDALHIVERYRRPDANTLEINATVEDPKVLTAPWVVPTQTLRLAPFDQIMEVGCSGVETASLMEGAAKVNYGKK